MIASKVSGPLLVILDPVASGLRAVNEHSVLAIPLVFLAGLITSVGPCLAPRFIAAAGLAAHGDRKMAIARVGSMMAGLIATYALFGAMAPAIARVGVFSTAIYVCVAGGLLLAGVRTLLLVPAKCGHSHPQVGRSGGAFFLGVSFALVLSPCCAPVLLAIVTYTLSAGTPLYGCALLAAFALGHALPLALSAFGVHRAVTFGFGAFSREAAATVSGALMVALGLYYAALA